MQQNRVLFFSIIGLAILIVIGMVIGSFILFGSVGEVSPLQPNINIEVVVAPSLEPWATQAAQEFNRANPRTHVTITEARDLIPEAQFSSRGSQSSPPAAWLAEATFVIDMARSQGFSFEDAQSVAGTSLAWGAFNNKLDQFRQTYGDLNWSNINKKATGRGGTKVVLAAPWNSAEGLAALASGVAATTGTDSLSGSDVGQANNWLTATLGNSNARTPATPAQSFASVQGRTLGDAGILSTVSWRQVGLDASADFTVVPVEPTVTLDYPLALWTGSQSTPEAQAAAKAFRDFLLQESQQTALSNFHFEQAVTGQQGVQLDASAAARLLNWANRELR